MPSPVLPFGFYLESKRKAARLSARDLPEADLPALLGLLRAGAGPTVRAFGRVLTAGGQPAAGRAFVYRVAGARSWAALIGARAHKGRTAGPLDAQVATLTAKTVDLVAATDPRGGGFFDIPGGLPPGTYALDVHAPDGTQAWAWPLVVGDGSAPQDVVIGGPPATPSAGGGASGPAVGPIDESKLPPVTPLERHFTAGTFTASFSYYGLGGAPLDRIQRDLARFRAAGFGNARVWHQEPARRNYPNPGDAPWPVSEFEKSFASARAAGAVGCCFHTGACFDVTARDGWDQLDDVERQVVARVAPWIR